MNLERLFIHTINLEIINDLNCGFNLGLDIVYFLREKERIYKGRFNRLSEWIKYQIYINSSSLHIDIINRIVGLKVNINELKNRLHDLVNHRVKNKKYIQLNRWWYNEK